jgi:hypothetical protein
MSCTVPGVHMNVYEAGRHKLSGGIYLSIDGAIVAAPYMNDPVALVNEHTVPDQRVRAAIEPNDPTAANDGTHRLLLWCGSRVNWKEPTGMGPTAVIVSTGALDRNGSTALCPELNVDVRAVGF